MHTQYSFYYTIVGKQKLLASVHVPVDKVFGGFTIMCDVLIATVAIEGTIIMCDVSIPIIISVETAVYVIPSSDNTEVLLHTY